MTEYTIKELVSEAAEIIRNAYQAWREHKIDRWQYLEVRNNTLRDMGARAEVINERMME